MGRRRYELLDSEWDRIAEMLPKEHPPEGKRGRPTKYDNRSVMNGILWIARSGA
ncbi:MAG: transposase, partial [Ruminococcus sp.]|nr:transposase [Ruminococcus sp.]